MFIMTESLLQVLLSTELLSQKHRIPTPDSSSPHTRATRTIRRSPYARCLCCNHTLLHIPSPSKQELLCWAMCLLSMSNSNSRHVPPQGVWLYLLIDGGFSTWSCPILLTTKWQSGRTTAEVTLPMTPCGLSLFPATPTPLLESELFYWKVEAPAINVLGRG